MISMIKDYAVSLMVLAVFFAAYTGLLFWQNQKRPTDASRVSASVSAPAPTTQNHFQTIEAGRTEP